MKKNSSKNTKNLTILGKPAKPGKKLEYFPNKTPDRFYLVKLETHEFTCVCPVTGQPDFADITVEYIPDQRILESKSFKLYLWSYRNEGVFHEHVTNTLLDDLVSALDPHWCRVIGVFNPRGGIGISITAEHTRTPEAKKILGDL